MNLTVEYKNNSGTYIVRVDEGKYYYGNGSSFNGFGISPVQFLRFNPSMDYVADKKEEPPEIIVKWIEEHIKERD